MCTSEFLFEVEDTTFSQNASVALPLDYAVTVAEDSDIGTIIQEMQLTDVFSTGPYSITLYKGKKNFHTFSLSIPWKPEVCLKISLPT